MLKLSCIHKVGDYMDKTKVYDVAKFKDSYIIEIVKDVSTILEERGYNSINQIVGYLMSGDPGYITSYKNARKLMLSVDRAKVLELLLKLGIK